uniref:Uncharacterized protein n=1 Tax=Anguilla anguilla TaxID=7936 RepID=A0A0E9S4N3_ANGAN
MHINCYRPLFTEVHSGEYAQFAIEKVRMNEFL